MAEKSRENSELQVLLSEQCGKFGKEFQELERNYEELKTNKKDLEEELLETKETLETELKKITQEKSHDYTRLTKDLSTLQLRCESLNKALRKSESKVQALEDCLKDLKGSSREYKELMDVANLRADLLALTKEKETFKDSLENEIDARKLLEDHVKTVTEEMSKLKQEFNQAEKDKLEAETRLEVLSTYFNNKETQLQKYVVIGINFFFCLTFIVNFLIFSIENLVLKKLCGCSSKEKQQPLLKEFVLYRRSFKC